MFSVFLCITAVSLAPVVLDMALLVCLPPPAQFPCTTDRAVGISTFNLTLELAYTSPSCSATYRKIRSIGVCVWSWSPSTEQRKFPQICLLESVYGAEEVPSDLLRRDTARFFREVCPVWTWECAGIGFSEARIAKNGENGPLQQREIGTCKQEHGA